MAYSWPHKFKSKLQTLMHTHTPGCSPSPSSIISTKLDGKTPILPFSDPSHQPSSTCNISICINPLLTSTVLLQHPTSASPSTLSSLPLCCFNTQHQPFQDSLPLCYFNTHSLCPFTVWTGKINESCHETISPLYVNSLCNNRYLILRTTSFSSKSIYCATMYSHAKKYILPMSLSIHCVTMYIHAMKPSHLFVSSLFSNVQSCHVTISPLSVSVHCVAMYSHAMKPSGILPMSIQCDNNCQNHAQSLSQ